MDADHVIGVNPAELPDAWGQVRAIRDELARLLTLENIRAWALTQDVVGEGSSATNCPIARYLGSRLPYTPYVYPLNVEIWTGEHDYLGQFPNPSPIDRLIRDVDGEFFARPVGRDRFLAILDAVRS